MEEFVTLTVVYRDKDITSIPLLMTDNSEVAKIVMAISEQGTNALNMLKIPTSDTSFTILSKMQLNESVIRIDVLTPEQVKEFNKTPKKKKE